MCIILVGVNYSYTVTKTLIIRRSVIYPSKTVIFQVFHFRKFRLLYLGL